MICPKLLQFWLSLGGVRPHIKIGLGQINGVFVASWFCHSLMPKDGGVVLQLLSARIPNVFNLDTYERGEGPRPYFGQEFSVGLASVGGEAC